MEQQETKKIKISPKMFFILGLLIFTTFYFGASAMIIDKQYNKLVNQYNDLVDEINSCKKSIMGIPKPTFVVPMANLTIQ